MTFFFTSWVVLSCTFFLLSAIVKRDPEPEDGWELRSFILFFLPAFIIVGLSLKVSAALGNDLADEIRFKDLFTALWTGKG